MKVTNMQIIEHEIPVTVYDVVNAAPNHNFIVYTDTGCIVAHNCGFMDEVNFARAGVKDINKAKSHMKDTFNTVTTRIEGTFRMGGEVFGKMFAVSSKRTDSDFMEAYLQEQLDAGAENLYVTDAPQWEVFPPGRFKDETFCIAIGNRYQKGFVLNEDQCFPEAIADLEAQGYTILRPPIDMKTNFMADFDISLRDLAGISVIGALSFITQATLDDCINSNRNNPFYSDVLSIGTKDSNTIESLFHINEVPSNILHCPMFIHLDLSKNADKTGIGAVSITGRKSIINEEGKSISQPMFTHIFSVSLEAPRGDQIPYDKITAFVCWLRKAGFNVVGVSADQFQSLYMMQLLEAQGFKVSNISLDRTPDPYMGLRSVFIEQRIDLLNVELLTNELVHLQRDPLTGKLDHPIGIGKDMADGLGGAVWNAIVSNPGIPLPGKTLAKTVAVTNRRKVTSTAGITSADLPSMFADIYSGKRKPQ